MRIRAPVGTAHVRVCAVCLPVRVRVCTVCLPVRVRGGTTLNAVQPWARTGGWTAQGVDVGGACRGPCSRVLFPVGPMVSP